MKRIMGILVTLFLLTGCSQSTNEASAQFFAMDTYMSLTAEGEAAEQAIDECQLFIGELEKLISRTEENSEIYALNHSEGEVVVVSDMTYEIISIAVECAEETEGKFDPTICAITDLWGIGTDEQCVPSVEEMEVALETVSYQNILLLGENKVQLLNGAQVDLGAVGKGYAADALYEIYEKYEITSGIISLGGNLYLVGEKSVGSPWNVGIVDPDSTEEYSIGIEVEDKSVVTTGAYERYFEADGEIYHHIFNTKTGYPTNENLKSVTIVSENSTLGDIYATALFAMGFEDAVNFIEGNSEIEAVMIREDNYVYISEGLAGSVTLDSKYTN